MSATYTQSLTWFTGHQLRSNSTTEMYIQCLLLGCRCVELDCWPENDTIIITHGGTFCGKVGFEVCIFECHVVPLIIGMSPRHLLKKT